MSSRRKFSADLELCKDGREKAEQFATLQHHLRKGRFKTHTSAGATQGRGNGPDQIKPAEACQDRQAEHNQ